MANQWAPNIPPRPSRSLAGRVAIVTGAGAEGEGIGNGRAAAVLLAEAGAYVVCVDVREEMTATTIKMIEQDGKGKAISFKADVTQKDECKAIVDKAVQTWGRLDILVNNVGINGPKGNAVDVDMEGWTNAMNVNVTSMVLMAKYAIPEMKKNTDTHMYKGSIVNIGSVAGLKGGIPHILYPTTKGAVVNMTRAMAAHHAPDGIRVNCVCPGMVFTPMMYLSDEGSFMTPEMREKRKGRSLMRTEGSGWDIGAGVRYLSSDEARWVTGVILPVDAGATAAVLLG
ncbi:short chain dehydrogenase/reductase SDR [Rhizodiscina lignyota]|uniref:Short chain dehydrogenase/reductase SDR n=1 Tax=Rhizodiscina lignyota TaxID=1504668 RepID=A0A9P4IF25_9PEZI|nr:short chain dehydrogenase/reductase SDR [Rhizodiscina lignyota]